MIKNITRILCALFIYFIGCMHNIVSHDFNDPSSQKITVLRSATTLRIEEAIQKRLYGTEQWEMAEYRTYKQEDLDGDGIDDTVLITTFEDGMNWERVLFISLSNSNKVLYKDLGGKGFSMAENFKIENLKILVSGKLYAPADANCCPSIPHIWTYVIRDMSIEEYKEPSNN